ncbi:MAG: hypothetical protein EZS28_005599 [Streblomastix strix]|uniref:Uncharacterized protein n=1 Tax=Streblomastix strix TaxID=222440 RepID=A0A5J4WX62_9EUKA|nr:MAG: hypothetical protein EZS28_005599 [Streblomastix strix]
MGVSSPQNELINGLGNDNSNIDIVNINNQLFPFLSMDGNISPSLTFPGQNDLFPNVDRMQMQFDPNMGNKTDFITLQQNQPLNDSFGQSQRNAQHFFMNWQSPPQMQTSNNRLTRDPKLIERMISEIEQLKLNCDTALQSLKSCLSHQLNNSENNKSSTSSLNKTQNSQSDKQSEYSQKDNENEQDEDENGATKNDAQEQVVSIVEIIEKDDQIIQKLVELRNSCDKTTKCIIEGLHDSSDSVIPNFIFSSNDSFSTKTSTDNDSKKIDKEEYDNKSYTDNKSHILIKKKKKKEVEQENGVRKKRVHTTANENESSKDVTPKMRYEKSSLKKNINIEGGITKSTSKITRPELTGNALNSTIDADPEENETVPSNL